MMISPTGQGILKSLHLLAVICWMGGCLAIFTLNMAAPYARSDEELYGLMRASMLINSYMVVYLGAFGSFFTGLAYSLCTNRGFFRHKWIIIKWLATIAMICTGFAMLGPWAGQELDAVFSMGRDALAEADIASIRAKRLGIMAVEFVVLVGLVVLSVFRPWERSELFRKGPKHYDI